MTHVIVFTGNFPVRMSFARGGNMPFPYELLAGGEALAKLPISSRATDPSDCWRADEDRTAAFGDTKSAHACVETDVLVSWNSI